ncbi:tape measure protein [Massilia sp. UMI-21]|nr:tape measure protein [Massilia sp. UMI-21]
MIVGDMEIRLRADIARLQRDMNDARRVVTAATAGMERAARAAKSALGGIASALGGRELIQMTDEYTKFTAQLKLATQSQREYAAAYADVKRISTQSTQGLGETGVLYARIANGTRELGVAQKQVAAITETVNLALMVSGATASESASAQLQLSQAFASGTLRGEEFNAVNEAAPRLMLALADGIGVPVGALKKMAEEGEITSKIMSDVLPNALVGLRKEAKEIQTIAGAFTVLKNNAMEFVGVQAQANGVVAAAAGGLTLLANNLALVAGSVMTLGAARLGSVIGEWVASTYRQITAASALRAANIASAEAEVAATGAKLAQLSTTRAMIVVAREEAMAKLVGSNANITAARTAMTAAQAAGAQSFALRTLRLATAELAVAEAQRAAMVAELAILGRQQAAVSAQITAATAAQTAAQAGLNAATTAGVGAASLASRALGFLGGPIGAVITLLGIGAMAWSTWKSKAVESEKEVARTLAEETEDYIANLQRQIDKLNERNELAGKRMTSGAEPTTDYEKRREAIMAEINRISKDADLGADAKTEQLRVWGGRLNQLTTDMERLSTAQQKNKDISFDSKYSDWLGKNGNAAQKEAYELEELRKEYGRVTPEMEKFVKAKYADKGAAASIKQEATAYQSLVTSIDEKLAATALELQGYDKLSDSQKMAIKLDAEIKNGKSKLSVEHVKEARAKIEQIAAQEDLLEVQKQAAKWAEAESKNDADHYTNLRAGTAAIDDRIKQMQREIDLHGMSASAAVDAERAKLEAKLAAGPATYAELAALDAQIEKLGQLAELTRKKETLDAGSKAAQQAAEDWKRSAESIEQSLTDALLRGFESGKSFGRNLVDTLKNMFSTLVLRPVVQGVVQSGMSMGGSALGMVGTGTGAANGASSMLSTMGSAGSIYGAYQSSALGQFMSGMSGSASYASQALGAPMTSAAQAGSATASGLGAGGATPWLGMAGGGLAAYQVGEKYGAVAGGLAGAGTIAAGGALTGAMGGAGAMAGATAALAAVPVWGWIAIAALSILGGMQKGPEKSTHLTFGSNNAAGNISINERGNEGKIGQSYIDGSSTGAFGSFGVVSSFWMNAAQPAVQDFIKSVTATDDALSKFMSETEKAAVKTTLTAQRTVSNSGPEGSDPNGLGGLDKVFSERIKTIFNTLEPGLDTVLAGFKGNSQQLGAEAEALLQYRTTLAQTGEALFGAKVTLQELAALAQPTEAVSTAIGRITSQFELTNAVAASLGKTTAEAFGAAGLASLGAREKFVSAAGGFYALAANAEGFARDFLTEAERNAPVLKMVTARMEALGFAGLETREEFKQVVMGLDLATDGGVKMYAELMNVAAAFAQVHPAIEQTSSAADNAAKVLQERAALQDQLDQLTMTSAQLLEKQRNALDESNRALFDQIEGIKAQAAAVQATKDRAANLLSGVDSMFSALQSVVTREKALLQDSVNAHRALLSALRGALDSMSVSGRELEDRQNARAQVQTALAIAKAGGVLPNADSLKGALSVLSKDASSMFATQQDYLRDFYSTQNDIAALAGLTDDALSVEEKSLAALDGILANAEQQISALKGIDMSVFSVAEAVSGLARAMGAAKADPVASAGGSIASLYKELLGRPADSAGLDYWQNAVAGGMSLDQVRKLIMQSGEFKGIPGFASGGLFGGGLRIVGENGPELEATGPSRIWSASQTSSLLARMSSPSDNSVVLVAAVERLTAENREMRRELNDALYAIAKNTMNTADHLDAAVNGDVPLATKVIPA